MTLEVALDADCDWDSSIGWADLARVAALAAIAESRFPALAAGPRAVELSVRLSDDKAVQTLNARWRGKDYPTNVLSFPLAEEEDLTAAGEGPELLLGDIILARQRCCAEAADKQIALEAHAAHLLVHGTLHLLGYDHDEDQAASEMEQCETRALSRLGIADPYREMS